MAYSKRLNDNFMHREFDIAPARLKILTGFVLNFAVLHNIDYREMLRNGLIEKFKEMTKNNLKSFGYWPVTTPLESCFWAWSKLEPESTSATPYLNAKGLGGPVNGSFFTGTVEALSGLKTGLESARTKGNKMTRQALKIKCILILSKCFFRDFFYLPHDSSRVWNQLICVCATKFFIARRRTLEVNHARSGPRRYFYIFRSEKSHRSHSS